MVFADVKVSYFIVQRQLYTNFQNSKLEYGTPSALLIERKCLAWVWGLTK